MNDLMKDYHNELAWSQDNQWWVADIPDIPFCAADGPTPEKALIALNETFEVLQEVYQEDGESSPEPENPNLPTIESLKEASKYLKISRIAEKAGMNPHTLQTKLKRGSLLKEEEAGKILNFLTQKWKDIAGIETKKISKNAAHNVAPLAQVGPKTTKKLSIAAK